MEEKRPIILELASDLDNYRSAAMAKTEKLVDTAIKAITGHRNAMVAFMWCEIREDDEG